MSEDLREELSDIFSDVCKALKHKLQDKSNVTAAEINAAVTLLKHNGITAIPVKGSPFGDLAEAVEATGQTLKFPFPVQGGAILPEDDPAVPQKAEQSG